MPKQDRVVLWCDFVHGGVKNSKEGKKGERRPLGWSAVRLDQAPLLSPVVFEVWILRHGSL